MHTTERSNLNGFYVTSGDAATTNRAQKHLHRFAATYETHMGYSTQYWNKKGSGQGQGKDRGKYHWRKQPSQKHQQEEKLGI